MAIVSYVNHRNPNVSLLALTVRYNETRAWSEVVTDAAVAS